MVGWLVGVWDGDSWDLSQQFQTSSQHNPNRRCSIKLPNFALLGNPVLDIPPKQGSTVKNFRLESWPKIFLWSSIYVGTMPFHFQQNFQSKIFHRDRDRHHHQNPTYFCKICKNSENILKKYKNQKKSLAQQNIYQNICTRDQFLIFFVTQIFFCIFCNFLKIFIGNSEKNTFHFSRLRSQILLNNCRFSDFSLVIQHILN